MGQRCVAHANDVDLSRENLGDLAEVGDATVARAERGEPISWRMALRLAGVLGLPIEQLMADP